MSVSYMVFEAPNEIALDIPASHRPLAIIRKDYPPFITNVPSIYLPDSKTVYTGVQECTAFLKTLVPEPIAVKEAAVKPVKIKKDEPVVVGEETKDEPVIVGGEAKEEPAVEVTPIAPIQVQEPVAPVKKTRRKSTKITLA